MMMMMAKCQFHWWRKPEDPEETTDLRQITYKTFTHTVVAGLYAWLQVSMHGCRSLCMVAGLYAWLQVFVVTDLS